MLSGPRRMAPLLLLFFLAGVLAVSLPTGLACDMESKCPSWSWGPGLINTTGHDISKLFEPPQRMVSGPTADARGSPDGHFLYLRGSNKSQSVNVTSLKFNSSLQACQLHFIEHTFHVDEKAIQVIALMDNHQLSIQDKLPLGKNKWNNVKVNIGKRSQPFHLQIELLLQDKPNSHVALDDIRLVNCFPEPVFNMKCRARDFKCSNSLCIDRSHVCDIKKDCPNGEDEHQDCDLMPSSSWCNFEDEANPTCGWSSEGNAELVWLRQRGPAKYNKPRHDHTFQNDSGHYIFLQKGRTSYLNRAHFNSSFFNPPPRYHGYIHSPYYNSCQFRFFFYVDGSSPGALSLILIEDTPHEMTERFVWHKTEKNSDTWHRAVVPLPQTLYRYRLCFEGFPGRTVHSFVAFDDFSFSPECFGIGVNVSEVGVMPPTQTIATQNPLHNYTRYHFSTCDAEGRVGPSNSFCHKAYEDTPTRVHIEEHSAGVQRWTVNQTGQYSVTARGASGGQGMWNNETSRGAVARGMFNWTAGDHIFVLVGQKGKNSCQPGNCRSLESGPGARRNLEVGSGGSGGGGATYVYKVDSFNRWVLLLAAAGGGGLGMEPSSFDSYQQDGRAENQSVLPLNGLGDPHGAGGGGGWNDTRMLSSGGQSLVQGGRGGEPCAALKHSEAVGGYGGGGGACYGGGGGGGYAGGSAGVPDNRTNNGEGGYSYVSGLYAWAEEGMAPHGHGSLDIVTTFVGCGCQHLCIVVDLERQETACVCPDDQQLENDNVSCQALPSSILANKVLGLQVHHLVIIIICAFVLMTCIGTAMFFLYHRYRRQKMKTLRQELFGNAELQLNRLRQQTGGMVTEYNPNYEFGGSSCTVQDLKEVPRESLTLVKALGQGAFGEVYQGYLVAADNNEIPVAVKTLPELSASQAEMDFLMEALIMSKFNHPNIVSFIGVCFDKLPKFIVLELLPGGDLKSFLRESRPKPDRPSPLTMCDLLMLAMDVAKGCQYLEENHFIHRDIAARNCLLSTKGAGRVVKIADFGMARDIYRADYYRKGGKAMLPVKWMPPEAFLDGIFTSKTDVWSFGVLLWEVMSLGYMPYPGRGNQEVMQLVTSGGRLEPPSNCPGPVYHIMAQCWHSVPDERPNFVTILERIGYCLQDPDVIHASLPVFHRPPSTERDTTVMRPPETDSCLQVARPGDSEPLSPASTDYLIPIPALSNYSLSTERTDLHSPSSADSDAGLLDLDARSPDAPPMPTASEPTTVLAPEPLPFSGQAALSRSCDSSPHTKKRAGGYTSVPTYDETPPPPPQFSSSVPESSIARQRPRSKPPGQSLMALDRPGPLALAPQPNSLSALDVSALARQHPTTPAPPYPYANVDVNSVSPLVPKSVVNDKMDTYIIGNHFVERCNEKEINC